VIGLPVFHFCSTRRLLVSSLQSSAWVVFFCFLSPGAKHKNRMGILLGNAVTDYASAAAAAAGAAGRTGRGGACFPESGALAAAPPAAEAAGAEEEEEETPAPAAKAGGDAGTYGGSGTLTLTPVLWSLLNVLPARDVQRPHRHQSIALDLCVYAAPGGQVYTLMGPELDEVRSKHKKKENKWEILHGGGGGGALMLHTNACKAHERAPRARNENRPLSAPCATSNGCSRSALRFRRCGWVCGCFCFARQIGAWPRRRAA
jgi:hypothetical protein